MARTAHDPSHTHYGLRVRGVIMPHSIPLADCERRRARSCTCMVSVATLGASGRVLCVECEKPWAVQRG